MRPKNTYMVFRFFYIEVNNNLGYQHGKITRLVSVYEPQGKIHRLFLYTLPIYDRFGEDDDAAARTQINSGVLQVWSGVISGPI